MDHASKDTDGYLGPALTMASIGIPYRAMFDFTPVTADELGMQEGDELGIIDRPGDWWMAELNGNRGLVPSNYLEPISGSVVTAGSEAPPNVQIEISPPIVSQNMGYSPREIVPEPSKTQSNPASPTSSTRPAWPMLPGLLSISPTSSPSSPALPSPFSGSNWIPVTHPLGSEDSGTPTETDGVHVLPTQVRALFDVTGTRPGELSYKAGDIIDVELRSTAAVWCGRLGSRAGTFRLDFSVEPILQERVRALWDYSPTSTEDLTFKAGDIIQIIGPSSLGNWWWHGWIEGKGIGTFPFNFVEPLEDDPDHSEDEELPLHSKPISKCLVRFRVLKDVESLEEGMLSLKQGDIIDLVERQTTERWLGRLKSQVGTFLLDESVEPIMTDRVKALFDYTATNPEELDFKANDIITVVGPSDDSTFWWYGALEGRLGMVPFNFIELIPDERDSNSDSDEWVDVPGLTPQTVKALHNFCSTDSEDLTFDKGDIINVVDSTSDSHWWKGELNGAVGMFPRTYCEVIAMEKTNEIADISGKRAESPPPIYSEPAFSEDFHSSGWVPSTSASKTPTTPNFAPPTSPRPDTINDRPSDPEPGEAPMSALVSEEPTSISSLALLANIKTAPSQKNLRDWLHMASALRKEGNQAKQEGKLQLAFVLLTKSVTCILEKIPSHSHYNELTATQRTNLTRNGEDMLQTLEQLKPVIENAYKKSINPPKSNNPFVKAVWDFDSEDPDDLPFSAGALIEVLDMPSSTSWWRGQLKGRVGLFPSNYVGAPFYENEPPRTAPTLAIPSPQLSTITEVTTPKTDPLGSNLSLTPSPISYTAPSGIPSGPLTKNTDLPWTPCFVRGLYEFTASEVGELGFLRGDIFEVTSMKHGSWWTAKLRDQTGIIPSNYVELIDLGGLLKKSQNEEKTTPKLGSFPHDKPDNNTKDEEPLQSKTPPAHPKIIVKEPEKNEGPGRSKSERRPIESYALSANRVVALHAWDSGRSLELVLKKGDIINVLERTYVHWWKGRLERDGSVGIFPANFVDPLQGTTSFPASDSSAPRFDRQPKRKATLDTDEGIVILRANIAKLFPLLQEFDINLDLASNDEIQDLYRDSSILRRRVLRLLEEQPTNDSLIQLEASFQEVKDYYDLIMELSASRHGRRNTNTSPNLLNSISSTSATVATSYSGGAFVSEPESDPIPFAPIASPTAPTTSRGGERKGTGGSTRMSLPATPSPAPPSSRNSFPFPEPTSSQQSSAWSSSLAALGNRPNAARYEGRLSVIAADIERARANYGSSSSRQHDRQLPPSPDARSLLRPGILPTLSVRGAHPKRKKTADSARNKNIYKRELEYHHQHVVHYTPQRRQGRP